MSNLGTIQTLLIFGLFFSVLSVYSDYNIDDYTSLNNEKTQKALAKCILAVDAHMGGNADQYSEFMSNMNQLLSETGEIHDKKQFWKNIRNGASMIALFLNAIAAILAHRLKNNIG
jgi:hypothetical protein